MIIFVGVFIFSPFLGGKSYIFIFMEIVLVTIGKTHFDFVISGIREYSKRLNHYLPFSVLELPDVKVSKSTTEAQQKEKEGDILLDRMLPSDFVILLDERGKQYSSMEFADYMERLMASGRKRILFVVGGPYGFAQRVYDRADAKISLSRMTFNHEMVRLFFVEQIYRAMTILRGEPYHHE